MKTHVTSPPAGDQLVEQWKSATPASSAIGQRGVAQFAEHPRQRKLTQPLSEVAGRGEPIGIAEWETQIVEKLPEDLKGSLPTVEEIEAELGARGTR